MNPFIRIIPPYLVRTFARPYVAGDSLDRALDVAADLQDRDGLLTTLDLLAEDIEREEEARRNIDTYLRMVDAVSGDTRFDAGRGAPTISMKLSSYTTSPLDRGGGGDGCREAAFEIIERARDRGVRLTVDMESSAWTDFTLELFRDLIDAGHDHVGIVLQTRLNRTAEDLQNLPPGCRVRLVIGIYQEPGTIALTDKTQMKARLIEQGRKLLERGHYLELATHDERVIRRFLREILPENPDYASRFEVQMLYGVPREALKAELKAAGIPTRLYVPFAVGWDMAIAYLRRRLDEYPRMMLLVARNLFAR